MNQFIKSIAYTTATLLLIVSCTTDEESENGTDPIAPGLAKVTLYVDAQPEILVQTRATEDETLFRPEVSVLVFENENNKLVPTSKLTQKIEGEITGVGNRRKLEVTLKSATGSYTFVVVANAQKLIGGAAIDWENTGMSYSHLQKIITQTLTPEAGVVTPITGKYMPMVGSSSVTNITGSMLIGTPEAPLRLQRIVAKVSIHFENSSTGAFRLMGISAAGVPTVGNILPDLNAALPTPQARASYFADNNVPTTLSPMESNPVYLFESVNSPEEETSHVSIVMKGKYNDKDSYYHIDLVQTPTAGIGGTRLDLLRNHHYRIHIKSVEIMGYNSAAEALAQKPSNINYDITMEDETALDIVSNGQYALTFSDGVNFALEARNVNTSTDKFSLGTITSVAPGESEGDSLKTSYFSSKLKLESTDFKTGIKKGELVVSIPKPTENVINARITVQVGNLSKDIIVNYQPVVLKYTENITQKGSIPVVGQTYTFECQSNVNDWYVKAKDKTGPIATSTVARGASFWKPDKQSVSILIPNIGTYATDEREITFEFYQNKYYGNTPFYTFKKIQDFLILDLLDNSQMKNTRRLGDGYGYTSDRVLVSNSITLRCNLPGAYLEATSDDPRPATFTSKRTKTSGDRFVFDKPFVLPINDGRTARIWRVVLKHERKGDVVFGIWDMKQTHRGLYIITTRLDEVTNPDPRINTRPAKIADGSGVVVLQEDEVIFNYIRFPHRSANPLGVNLGYDDRFNSNERDPCTQANTQWMTPETKGNSFYRGHGNGFKWTINSTESSVEHYFSLPGWQDKRKNWQIRDTRNDSRSSKKYFVFGTTSYIVYGTLHGRDFWNSSYSEVVDESWVVDGGGNGAFYIRCQPYR